MKRVMLESPYRGDVRGDHRSYTLACMKDSIGRGESPFAAHLLYTQLLDDDDPEQRKLGLKLGMRWLESADLVAMYVDRGVSEGMQMAKELALRFHVPIETRQIGFGLDRNKSVE